MARRDSAIQSEMPERTLGTRIFALVVIVVAVGIFGLVVWRAATTDEPAPSVAEVPLIAAEAGPTRVRPDDPGGMAIPHQDKLIYQEIEDGDGEPLVERLLPPPEEPVSRTRPELDVPDQLVEPVGEPEPPVEAAQAPTPDLQTAEPMPEAAPLPAPPAAPVAETAIPALPAATPAAETPAPPSTDDAAPPGAPIPAAVTPPSEEDESPRLEIAAQRPVPTVTTIAVPSSAYRIQLAAFRGRADAEQAWDEIQGRAPSLLAALRPEVVRADLGADKGVFYRLQAGPIPDRTAADDLCRALQAVNQDCLVVAP